MVSAYPSQKISFQEEWPDPAVEAIFAVVAGRSGIVEKIPDRRWKRILLHWLAGEEAKRLAGLRGWSGLVRKTCRANARVSGAIPRHQTARQPADVAGVTTPRAAVISRRHR